MELDATRTRLLALAEERSVSLARLSRMLGKNASYLQQFIRKGSPRKLEENDRATLARFFRVDEIELGAPRDKYAGRMAGGYSGNWIAIPRLDLQASAGPGATADGEEEVGSFHFSERWLRDQGLQPDCLTAIAVRGDSMEPTLRDGDEILVESGPQDLRDGIHVVRVDGAILVKRLETSRPGRLTLLSDNAAYRPIERPADEVEVIGRAVWKSGRL